MEKLISMTDFVLEQKNAFCLDTITEDTINNYSLIQRYAEFLRQPLALGMFVPVDENGNFLEEPDVTCLKSSDGNCYCGEEQVKDCRQWKYEYRMAKEKVLFEGFEIEPTENNKCQYLWLDKKFICSFPLIEADRIRKIEDLIPSDIKLTSSALKQIGINQ